MSVTRPRGPLPARVYWTRRVLVLALACGLVFGVGRMLGGQAGGTPDPAAQPASVQSESSERPTPVSTADARPRERTKPMKTRAPLAMPTGPCQDSDVRVEPAMKDNAYAGGDVRLALKLTTYETPACNWEVSPDAVVVKLTSGSDRIWSTQDCPQAVPTEAVVLRKRKATRVDVTWSGRRSDPDCSRTTQWAEPGYYHLSTAAMGSEPESQQFRLVPPAPVTITPKPTPRPKAKDAAKRGER